MSLIPRQEIHCRYDIGKKFKPIINLRKVKVVLAKKYEGSINYEKKGWLVSLVQL